MNSEYDKTIAFHYSSYRPSLHLPILEKCIDRKELFSLGLDVGCGTGQSSVALAEFCDKVIGIDPSKEMLQNSIMHRKVAYEYYNKTSFDFSDNYFDLITFAGSLYYAKSQKLIDEVIRTTKSTSKIIAYDFNIPLDGIFDKLKLERESKQSLTYDHQVNFDGLDNQKIEVENKFQHYLSIEISIPNLSHLLLSSKENYHLLQKSFEKGSLYDIVSQKLYEVFNLKNITINAITYATVYRNIK